MPLMAEAAGGKTDVFLQRIFLEGAGFLDLWPLFAAIMAVTVVAVLAAVFSFHHKIS